MAEVQSKHGFCAYEFASDYVHIYDLFVYPDSRRKGEARKILLEAIRRIRESGYSGEISIVAYPREGNISKEQLSDFYESLWLSVFSYY